MSSSDESPWDDWGPLINDLGHNPTPQEILWRMKGVLDCLRLLKKGPIDPLYVEYLVEKTGEKKP